MNIFKRKTFFEKNKKNSRFKDWPEDRTISIAKNKKLIF